MQELGGQARLGGRRPRHRPHLDRPPHARGTAAHAQRDLARASRGHAIVEDMPTGNFGIRADVRRFQTGAIEWDDIGGLGDIDDLPLPKFDFWRATAGITFKF